MQRLRGVQTIKIEVEKEELASTARVCVGGRRALEGTLLVLAWLPGEGKV